MSVISFRCRPVFYIRIIETLSRPFDFFWGGSCVSAFLVKYVGVGVRDWVDWVVWVVWVDWVVWVVWVDLVDLVDWVDWVDWVDLVDLVDWVDLVDLVDWVDWVDLVEWVEWVVSWSSDWDLSKNWKSWGCKCTILYIRYFGSVETWRFVRGVLTM